MNTSKEFTISGVKYRYTQSELLVSKNISVSGMIWAALIGSVIVAIVVVMA